MIKHRVPNSKWNYINTTDDTGGVGTVYPSGVPEFTAMFFLWGLCYSIFSFMCKFCRSLFIVLYFFFWPYWCLFFFDLWIQIILWYLQTLLDKEAILIQKKIRISRMIKHKHWMHILVKKRSWSTISTTKA
jgi:hypothetical protein